MFIPCFIWAILGKRNIDKMLSKVCVCVCVGGGGGGGGEWGAKKDIKVGWPHRGGGCV